jgi:hypothetical protein
VACGCRPLVSLNKKGRQTNRGTIEFVEELAPAASPAPQRAAERERRAHSRRDRLRGWAYRISAKSIPELIAYSKINKVSVGSGGIGGQSHICLALFGMLTGVETAAGPLNDFKYCKIACHWPQHGRKSVQSGPLPTDGGTRVAIHR